MPNWTSSELDSTTRLDSSSILVQYCNYLHDCYFDPHYISFSYSAITARGQVTSLDVIFLTVLANEDCLFKTSHFKGPWLCMCVHDLQNAAIAEAPPITSPINLISVK